LRTLTGLVLPNQAEVRIFGQRIGKDVEFPASTDALIDRPGFLPHSSGFRNLELLARIRGIATPARIAETMYFVGLDPHDPKVVGTDSTGMRQRLGLAQAIMEDPDLLILDEPLKIGPVDFVSHSYISNSRCAKVHNCRMASCTYHLIKSCCLALVQVA